LGVIKHCFLQESILGPLLFLHYVNNLLKTINVKSKIVLFADDTNIIFTKISKIEYFKYDITIEFEHLNK